VDRHDLGMSAICEGGLVVVTEEIEPSDRRGKDECGEDEDGEDEKLLLARQHSRD